MESFYGGISQQMSSCINWQMQVSIMDPKSLLLVIAPNYIDLEASGSLQYACVLPADLSACASAMAGWRRVAGYGTPSVMTMARFSTSGLSPCAKHCVRTACQSDAEH